MSYFASVNGFEIVGGSLLVPLVGVWTADLYLASAGPLDTGPATVTIGNLTLQGTVYRVSVYGGQVRARLVGGAGGWRSSVPAQGYGSPSGVQLSAVLGDVAAACGETVLVAADRSVGQAFVRLSATASNVLWQLVKQSIIPSWRVDVDGVTKTDAWPATVVTTPFTVTDARPDEGLVEIATEDYASWMPGCVFSAPQFAGTNAGVEYRWSSGGKLRFVVLTGTTGDRVLAPLQLIVGQVTQGAQFFGRYEYTISNPTPTTIDGTPTDDTIGLPTLQNLPITSDSLATYTPPSGGKAHVMFVNGQATRPVCVWTQADANAGPDAITLAPSGKGSNGVARVSDSATVIFPPLMQIAGVVNGVLPFVGVITITTPGIASISTGSQTVKATQ